MNTLESLGSIECLGETACRLLTARVRGKVLTVVSRAVYLLSEDGELFWLATTKTPMHRRGMRSGGALPSLRPDTPFEIINRHLVFNSETGLDFSRAVTWEAPRIVPERVLPIADLPRCFDAIPSFLDMLHSPPGFGSLIPEILMLASGQGSSRSRQIPAGIPGYAWPAVKEIAMACLEDNLPGVLTHASSLVGLGEGLTPSGDDFIGGLLFCILTLHSSYAGPWKAKYSSSPEFFKTISSSTNLISGSFLKDNAEGFAIEPLHQFAIAFLTGQPLGQLRQSARELVQIGHSTGWDLLTGFLVGILFAIGKQSSFASYTIFPIGDERNRHGYQTENRKSQ
jgi:hypothetical protein